MAWRNYKDNTVVWFDSYGKVEKLPQQEFDDIETISSINETCENQRIKFESNMLSSANIVLEYVDGKVEQVSFGGKNEILHQLLGNLSLLECSGLQENEKVNVIIYPYCEAKEASNFVEGKEGTASSLTQLLSVIKSELWYRMSYGLPLYDKISTKVQMDSVVLTIINNHSEVKSIKEFSSSISGHKYTANIKVETIFGPLQIGI